MVSLTWRAFTSCLICIMATPSEEISSHPEFRKGTSVAGSLRVAFRILVVSALILLALEFLLFLAHKRHGYFGFDGWFGSYAILGLGGCLALMFIARIVGAILVRSDEKNDPETIETWEVKDDPDQAEAAAP